MMSDYFIRHNNTEPERRLTYERRCGLLMFIARMKASLQGESMEIIK